MKKLILLLVIFPLYSMQELDFEEVYQSEKSFYKALCLTRKEAYIEKADIMAILGKFACAIESKNYQKSLFWFTAWSERTFLDGICMSGNQEECLFNFSQFLEKKLTMVKPLNLSKKVIADQKIKFEKIAQDWLRLIVEKDQCTNSSWLELFARSTESTIFVGDKLKKYRLALLKDNQTSNLE